MKVEEILLDHEKRITKNTTEIEAIKEALNTKKWLFYQIIGTIISGVGTAIVLNLVIYK